MSIENLLTLGVAAGILVVAALLRLLVLGVGRLYLELSGGAVPWLATADEGRARRPPARPALHRLGSLGSGLVYVLAIVGTWIPSAATTASRTVRSAYARLSPRVTRGAQRGLATAARKISSATTVTAAPGRHLGRAATERMDQRTKENGERDTRQIAEEARDARVIVLDREWDPLTDPLDEEPASNVR